MFVEFLHKLFTAVLGVGRGMGAMWYSQDKAYNMWIVGAVAVGIAFVVSLLFHPLVWLWRRRPRRRVEVDA